MSTPRYALGYDVCRRGCARGAGRPLLRAGVGRLRLHYPDDDRRRRRRKRRRRRLPTVVCEKIGSFVMMVIPFYYAGARHRRVLYRCRRENPLPSWTWWHRWMKRPRWHASSKVGRHHSMLWQMTRATRGWWRQVACHEGRPSVADPSSSLCEELEMGN